MLRDVERKLYIEPCAGLGNRLLALGSALFWAERLGRELVIVWKREKACAASWEKIFDKHSSFEVKEYNRMPKKLNNAIFVYKDEIAMKRGMTRAALLDCAEVVDLWNDEDDSVFADRITTDTKKVYIRAYCRFAPVEEMADCIKTLSFSEAIRSKVDGLMHSEMPIYGVHIRRTDHADAIKMSPTVLYEEKMAELEKKDPGCLFYIASDDQREIDNLKRKFTCITADRFSREISRDSDDGIMDAAVDMLCLSRCKKILGAYGSTFSSMASVIGNVPLVVVKSEEK